MKKYTLTLYIAAPGTPKTDGSKSISGHVYYSINDGSGEKGWGFSPTGFPYFNAPGHVIEDEFKIYKNPHYVRTMEITKEQYYALQEYGKYPETIADSFDSKWYLATTNSCVDFTYGALRHAKIYDKKIFGLINDEGSVKVLNNIKAFDSIPNQITNSPLNTPPGKRTHPMPKQEWYHKVIFPKTNEIRSTISLRMLTSANPWPKTLLPKNSANTVLQLCCRMTITKGMPLWIVCWILMLGVVCGKTQTRFMLYRNASRKWHA